MNRQDPGHFARIKQILSELHELGDADRREYLDEVCREDPELRAEIESLLSHEQDPSLVRPAPADAGETVFSAPVVEPVPLRATEPGAVLAGRYRIDAFLAAGGMGQVYRAHDLELDVPIALKTIRPEIASHPASLRLFKQEVLLARSITHSNVCRIFDLRRDDSTGVVFLTMEFLPGETLMSRIKRSGTFSTADSFPLARQMADALDAAHRAGIVHRDFKSPNVMLVPSNGCDEPNGERAVITDFGLAVTVEVDDDDDDAAADDDDVDGDDDDVDGDVQEPRSDIPSEVADPDARTAEVRGRGIPSQRRRPIVGTPAYMAPEQVAGDRVGPAADLYAFGVVLFEMCTGQLPFQEATPMDTARAHITLPPPRPGTLAIVDESWEEAILRLLSKNPDDRYATADEAVLALEGRTNGTAKVPHALPPERDIFVGRVEELQRLAGLLEPDTEDSAQTSRHAATSRLVTVLGLGGTGKSRLVQKYGWDSLLRWPGGVWFCDLTEARSVEEIATAVSSALDVHLGQQEPVLQLGNAIAGRGRCLVILDNFEQAVTHADATVGRWLEIATEARFLATSRARLQAENETTFQLEPLKPATRGVELFEARTWRYRPGFSVDASNHTLIVDIVEKLDGLPLAIEMAASRMSRLSALQLEQRLGDRFRLLAGRKKGRHATMEATLDWSWDLLEAWEQSAVAQASVFEGGFTLEAAEAVIELHEYESAPSTLDVLQSLVDNSWLRAKVALGSPRFSMYVTVQDYASAKLRDETTEAASNVSDIRGSLADIEARHGAYFATMGTDEVIEKLVRHGGAELRAVLHLDLDNLVAACVRAITVPCPEVIAPSYAAASAVFLNRGPFLPSIQLGRDALEVLIESRQRGRVLHDLAASERMAGEFDAACEHFEAAITTYRAVGDRQGEGSALGELGYLLFERGRKNEAWEYGEAALAIHREVGNRPGEGIVLSGFANILGSTGRVGEALEYHDRVLTICREVGDRRQEGITLGNLGTVHHEMGQTKEALDCYGKALAICRGMGIRHMEGRVLGNLANVAINQGRMKDAHDDIMDALAISARWGLGGVRRAYLATSVLGRPMQVGYLKHSSTAKPRS